MKPVSSKEAQQILKAIPVCMNWCISGARKATKYISPTLTVKVSRQRELDRRDRMESFVVSIGAPNYEERDFIKFCQNGSLTFPIKRIQLKFYED